MSERDIYVRINGTVYVAKSNREAVAWRVAEVERELQDRLAQLPIPWRWAWARWLAERYEHRVTVALIPVVLFWVRCILAQRKVRRRVRRWWRMQRRRAA